MVSEISAVTLCVCVLMHLAIIQCVMGCGNNSIVCLCVWVYCVGVIGREGRNTFPSLELSAVYHLNITYTLNHAYCFELGQ